MNLKISLLVGLVMWAGNCFPNNITVSNIHLSGKNARDNYVYLGFDVQWDNSWKINTGAQNWDAVWIFAKFRINGGAWKHVSLSPFDDQHHVPLEAVVDVSDDGKGAFIYRADFGSGTFVVNDVRLKWLYGNDALPDDEPNLEIKVFGIEMVYINEGDFYVGDGDATARLWDASDMEDNPAIVKQDPVVLRAMDYSKGDDDDLLKYSGIYVDGDEGIDMDGQSAVDNPNYPTGYKAFYCMKQEITNEQYAEFLNNLTREQQNGRAYLDISGASVENPFPINPSGHITYRNCVRYNNPSNGITEPVNFFCDLNNNGIPNEPDDGQNVIICWIGWPDGAAYADWAGLRPMTELEFEKACRGPEFPVPGSYAWNTSNIFADTTYFFNDLGGKAEYPKNPGEGIYANASYAITTGHPGPVNILNGPTRAGIFATASSDRVNSGASYYGVLDLTGGINERCVTIGGDKGRHFQGTHGDGQLTELPGEAGNATNTDWPGVVDTQLSNGVVGREGSGFRGGDWNDSATWGLLVSNRFAAAADPYFVDNPRNGNPGSGFRCVRSVK